MHTGRFVFSELIAHLPHQEFQKCVARYDGHPQPRKLSYWDQYLAMAFAQLTYRESLRAIRSKQFVRNFDGGRALRVRQRAARYAVRWEFRATLLNSG